MKQMQNLLARVLEEGVRRPNRTGVDTISVVGASLKFDLRQGFPAWTVKKLAFKSAVGELIGFFRGFDSAAQFRDISCPVWTQNANETKSWLASPYRKGEDDLGKIYGHQWTAWEDVRVPATAAQEQHLEDNGFEWMGFLTEAGGEGDQVNVYHRSINQLETCLIQILTDPYSRRILLSGWRPDHFDQMALPPCHVSYQIIADPDDKFLDLCVYQRSQDLALSFNTALDALYLEIFARLTGYTARYVHHWIADAHIYAPHVDGVREMLSRQPKKPPKLIISDNVRKVSADEVSGVFTRIQPEDFSLEGYEHHPPIKLAMAA